LSLLLLLSCSSCSTPSQTTLSLLFSYAQAHKAGRKAGPSARDKHRLKKDGGPVSSRASIKSGSNSGKMQRALAAKQQR
jgi:hypothetical protein